MTIHHVASFLGWVFLGLVIAYLAAYVTGHARLSDGLEMASDALFAVLTFLFFLDRDWVAAGLGVAFMVLLAWRDRRKRKKRKAGEALGAKSKARRDAIVRKARELARPRPSRVPVPVREQS